jgi:hypothetical protein
MNSQEHDEYSEFLVLHIYSLLYLCIKYQFIYLLVLKKKIKNKLKHARENIFLKRIQTIYIYIAKFKIRWLICRNSIDSSVTIDCRMERGESEVPRPFLTFFNVKLYQPVSNKKMEVVVGRMGRTTGHTRGFK